MRMDKTESKGEAEDMQGIFSKKGRLGRQSNEVVFGYGYGEEGNE